MVTLIILDGFGESKKIEGNAIKLAGTPNLDKLKVLFPHVQIGASGAFVGLPNAQMGNSEVGHLTIGSGRIKKQDLEIINDSIKNGDFFNNKVLNRACEFVTQTGGALHLIGMISSGGVHSHVNHLKALIELAGKKNVQHIYIHCITDGRDSEINVGAKFVEDLEKFCKGTNAIIASICGRAFAMDREERWQDKTMPFYDMLTLGKAARYVPEENAAQIFKEAYAMREFDEFILPSIIGKPKTIENGDSVIFFNFRPDRMRQIANALCENEFKYFPRKNLSFNYFVSLTRYDDDFKKIKVAFENENLKNTLAEVLAEHGLKQFHIAETTKYAHVTYYFNGGQEQPFKGEIRKLVPSCSDPDFTHNPQMKAIEIATDTIEAVASGAYDFILVNFSNADMLGHTANLDATMQAIKIVDKCAYAVAMSVLMSGGDCIITADHGNAEKLINEKGAPCTTHTSNPVEFILIAQDALPPTAPESFENCTISNSGADKILKAKGNINGAAESFLELNSKGKHIECNASQDAIPQFTLKTDGGLANIAPTILELMNIPKPKEMTSESLISLNPRKK